MKIICTVTNDLTFDQRMIRVCTSLSRAGHQVQLVGRSLPSSKPLQTAIFEQQRFSLFFNRGKLFYLEFNLRLFFYLLFSRFDVACAVDLDTLFPAFAVAFLKRRTCVYDAHEYFTEVPEVVERPFVKKTWETLARFLIPRLRFAYTVGESLAAAFTEKYGIPFEVIRNVPFRNAKGAAPHFKKSGSEFILLYQGVLNEGRGLEEMIRAMPLLPEARLWLAGEGDLSEMLREMVETKGLGRQIRFLGKLTPAELSNLTPQAHLGLNLLRNKGLNYYYSLANKAFDYIQAGLPSLNMNFPEYVQLNRQFEVFFLLEELSAPAIAEAVNTLRKEEALYQKLSANCRKAAAVLTWENEEEKLLAFYKKIEAGLAS